MKCPHCNQTILSKDWEGVLTCYQCGYEHVSSTPISAKVERETILRKTGARP